MAALLALLILLLPALSTSAVAAKAAVASPVSVGWSVGPHPRLVEAAPAPRQPCSGSACPEGAISCRISACAG
ncbi:MAG: hypothetical protein M0Z28_28520, partial [Rhodospirillales bacterium]|nr:hypothetical protein [Rhodospirillales bacterium]